MNKGRALLKAQATTADLEAEACWIQDSLKAVLDKHAPGRPPSARSKRWWTDDIKSERRRFGRARRDYNCDRISFGEYRHIRNNYYRHIRRAKRVAWESFLQGVFPTDEGPGLASDPERCWKSLRYTKPSVPAYTPAIKIAGLNGQPDRVASTAEEKEDIFIAQAFPTQVQGDEDSDIPDTKAAIGAREIREALFSQSTGKAPGADGIGFKALRLLWRWAEERVVALVQGCIKTGFHPCT